MLDCHWDVHELDAAPPGRTPAETTTLVAAVVANRTPTPRRVRLVPRFDGALHPPRREWMPEAGWTDEGFAGVVAAGERLPLGFAAGGRAPDPPVEVVEEGRADGNGGGPSPTELLRDLGSPAPPRDAVPAGDDAPSTGTRSGPGAGPEERP